MNQLITMTKKEQTFIGREVKYLLYLKKKNELFEVSKMEDLTDSFSCGVHVDIEEEYRRELGGGYRDEILTHTGVPVDDGNVLIESIGSQDRNGAEIYNGSLLKDDSGQVYKVVWVKEDSCYLLSFCQGRSKQSVGFFYDYKTKCLTLTLFDHILTSKEFTSSNEKH